MVLRHQQFHHRDSSLARFARNDIREDVMLSGRWDHSVLFKGATVQSPLNAGAKKNTTDFLFYTSE
jgi:hypothetical protein